MAFDLTQRPFEGSVRESFEDQAKALSAKAVKTKKNTSLDWKTSGGHLTCVFKPTGRVFIEWRDRGGIKEGWFHKDWSIATTIKKAQELLRS